jgi:phosphoribosylanthranilate isomerase
MKLKVCGLSNPNEVEICIKNNVNFCGFILNYPKSHRYISYEKAKKLLSINKNNTQFVGVLVQPSLEELKKFSQLNLDYFQLYGQYDNKSLKRIKDEFEKKVIATIQVKNKSDIEIYKKLEDASDIILWDSSGYEKSLSWNHSWIKDIKIKGEKMIAGNITKDKLGNLSKLADIIDVSGALETNKVKDTQKIIEFVKCLKKINNEN